MGSGDLGGNLNPSRCKWVQLRVVSSSAAQRLPANRHRVADGVKILLDIAKESSDWFPPLKSALGGVNALIKHYEVRVERVVVTHSLHERPQESQDVREKIEDLIPHLSRFKQTVNAAVSDGDQAENERRSELFRYARQFFAPPTLAKCLRSALGEIEKRSRALLAKGMATRFVDKGVDSGEVAKLVERLREAITHYQVSVFFCVEHSSCRETDIATTSNLRENHQTHRKNSSTSQSVVQMIDSFGKSSFDMLLNLHEVMQYNKSIQYWLTLEQGSPSVESKLDSILARLDTLSLTLSKVDPDGLKGLDRKSTILLQAARARAEGVGDNSEKGFTSVQDPGVGSIRGSVGTFESTVRARTVENMSMSSGMEGSADVEPRSTLPRRSNADFIDTTRAALDPPTSQFGGLRRHQMYDAPGLTPVPPREPPRSSGHIGGSPSKRTQAIKFGDRGVAHSYTGAGGGYDWSAVHKYWDTNVPLSSATLPFIPRTPSPPFVPRTPSPPFIPRTPSPPFIPRTPSPPFIPRSPSPPFIPRPLPLPSYRSPLPLLSYRGPFGLDKQVTDV
jgi:hypothetical protein